MQHYKNNIKMIDLDKMFYDDGIQHEYISRIDTAGTDVAQLVTIQTNIIEQLQAIEGMMFSYNSKNGKRKTSLKQAWLDFQQLLLETKTRLSEADSNT